MCNKEIKLKAAGSGIKLWQIAKELGLSDSSFSRKLREEFSDEEKQSILQIIHKLSKEGCPYEDENH